MMIKVVLVDEGLTVAGGWKLIETLGDQSSLLGGTAWCARGSWGVKGGFQGGRLTGTLACQVLKLKILQIKRVEFVREMTRGSWRPTRRGARRSWG